MLPYWCPAHKWRAHKLRAFTGRCSRSGRCESEPRSVLLAPTCYQTSTSVNMFALSWLLEVVLGIVLLPRRQVVLDLHAVGGRGVTATVDVSAAFLVARAAHVHWEGSERYAQDAYQG